MKNTTIRSYIRRQVKLYFEPLTSEEAFNVTLDLILPIVQAAIEEDITPFKKNIRYAIRKQKTVKARQLLAGVQERELLRPTFFLPQNLDVQSPTQNNGVDLLKRMNELIVQQMEFIKQLETQNQDLRDQLSTSHKDYSIEQFFSTTTIPLRQEESLSQDVFNKCEVMSSCSLLDQEQEHW